MVARLKTEIRENRILVESFLVFLAIAGFLVAGEFTVFALQEAMGQRGVAFTYPRTFLDDYIPFVPELVWPYWAYFGFLGISVWLPRNRRELGRLATGLTLIHVAGYVFFILYPTAFERIDIACETLSCGMVGAMYMLDPGYAVFPSLHVAASVYVAICCFVFRHRYRWFILAFALSIIAATVLIKQHYVVDIPAGVFLGIAGTKLGWWLSDYVADRADRLPLSTNVVED